MHLWASHRDRHKLAALLFAAFLWLGGFFPPGSVRADQPTAAWANPSYGRWHSCVIGGGGYLLNTLICPSDPRRLYVHGDMDGLFRSDDAGSTWRIIHGGMDVKGYYDFAGMAVSPRNAEEIAVACGSGEAPQSGGIFVSRDGGRTWAKTLDAHFMGNGPFRWAGSRIAGSCGKNGLLVTATEGTGVWRSINGGRTWQDCGLKGVYFTDVYFDKSNSQRIWLCAEPVQVGSSASGTLSGGLYRSEDSGKTWAKIADDSPFEMAQDPKDARVLYGLCDSGVKRSVDAGVTWQEFSGGLPSADSHLGADPFRALGTGPDFTLVVQNDTKALYRLDSGQTYWQKIEPVFGRAGWRFNYFSPPANDASSITVSPQNPRHWYLTDEFGIYQSWDSGKTWTPSNHGIEVTVIHTLMPDPSNVSGVYLGGGDIGFWWSDDAGTTLTQTKSASAGWVGNIKCVDASAKQPSRVYAVGGVGWKSDTVYLSTDKGRSVTQIPRHGNGLPEGAYACNSIVVDPNDPRSVYLATSTTITETSGGVYHSTDGGSTWVWIGLGLPVGKTVFQENIWWGGRELAMGPDGTLLAVSATCGSAFRYDKSRGSWSRVSLPAVGGIYSIVADLRAPGRFYACEVGDDTQPGNTQGGLFRTDDDGTTWKKLLAGSVHAIAIDRSMGNRIAASRPDGIVISMDGGSVWAALEPLPNRGTYDCLAFAGNRLLVGTGGNGAFWTDLRTVTAQAK